MSRIPPVVVAEVHERAHNYCEACGGFIAASGALHHRLPRSAGGEHTAANLMYVHGGFDRNCHNISQGSIHQNPSRSYRLGHLVHRGTDPASIAVQVVPTLHHLRK